VCGDPADLDGNLIERRRLLLRSKGPSVVINTYEHELARRSLWVLHRLDNGLAVGENNQLHGPFVILLLVNESSNRHLNTVKLGNVHC
jgi:hypothetical protein